MDSVAIIFSSVLLLATLLYAFFLFKVAGYWLAGKQSQQQGHRLPSEAVLISIIIPARNEGANIRACLQCILQQDYPPDRFEVLVVDDHSEDDTASQVRGLADPRIRLLQLPTQSHGKKAALSRAIELAKGDFLLFTDADCTAGSQWLNQIAQLALAGNDMILAPVQMQAKPRLLESFQALDVCGTILLTGAAVRAGRPILANGANLAINKQIFHELEGFTGNTHRASGDDIFLLQKAIKAPQTSIAFAYAKEASVVTSPTSTWTDLFWQRLRWAGKTGGYTDPYLILFQVVVYLIDLGLLLGLPLCFLAPTAVPLLVGAYAIKILSEYYYLRFATQEIGHPSWMNWFVPALILHTIYVVVIGSLALLPISSRWKGRSV